MREIDPFDYWQGHASAIAGMGGTERSPDPRYVFHTRYHEVRAGRARFVVRLGAVRAGFGELSVRVHAWKPETDSNVSLVSGARLSFDGEDGIDIELPIPFAAQKGVLYALYGYMSEKSDVAAQTLHVVIDEPEEPCEPSREPPLSALTRDRPAQEARPANALLHYGRADIEHPVSQSCTIEQVAALGLQKTRLLGRDRGENNDAALAQWNEALCLKALGAYAATSASLDGLVVGPVSAGYAGYLAETASLTRVEAEPLPGPMSGEFFDFLLMPHGFGTAPHSASERWEAVGDQLARLKIGGLAMLGLRYRPDGDLVGSSDAVDRRTLSRNEIGQWALRLIGSGYSVAPMAFAPVAELVIDGQGLAGFLLIVQRS